jgi:alkanesulfonate monooxygenase SsuD/methylene tetrahydromethanopterin reductase-like flavin-dependent oxidoreductase (luciferase family)
MEDAARRRLLFGYFPSPDAERYDDLVRLVGFADEAGLDLVGIQDHPYQRRFLDTWTLIAALAVRTERIRLFPAVASVPLRPPAVLAKAAASLDRMTGGRIELGLGAGGFPDAIAAMGGPKRSQGEAVSALEEAIAVIRLMWSGERGLRFDGQHYHLGGVHSGPTPAHAMGIWIGAYGPRMLRLTGRLADGWLPSSGFLAPDGLADANARIDEAAVAADRDPGEVLRLYNVFGTVTDGRREGPFHGPVDQWVETLAELAADGRMDGFLLGPGEEADEEEQLRRFATEVAPAVRKLVLEAG